MRKEVSLTLFEEIKVGDLDILPVNVGDYTYWRNLKKPRNRVLSSI